MNYLGHYYCTIGYSETSRVCSLIPDIFPKFSYLHNQYFKSYDRSGLNDFEQKFMQGVDLHYADDLTFHNSKIFIESTQAIEQAIYRVKILETIKRKYLLAHILFELLLDHWIICHEPNINSSIYSEVENWKSDSLAQFLNKILGKTDKIQLLLESLEHFKSRRFLNFYAEETNLIKALHKVTGKISAWDYNEHTENAFKEVIKTVKEQLFYTQILKEVKRNRSL